MIPPLPIDQQIAKALDKFRKEHYPHKAKAVYLGWNQWYDLFGEYPKERIFDGVEVYCIETLDHLNIG